MQVSTDTGSVLNLVWTSDGTQLAGAGANGRICFAQLVGLTAEVGPIRATLTDSNSVEVYHLLEETLDELDFRDRVIKMCLGEHCSSHWNDAKLYSVISLTHLYMAVTQQKAPRLAQQHTAAVHQAAVH